MRFFLNIGWVSIGVALVVVGCAADSRDPHERTTAALGTTRQALSTQFGAGTFIIPMDNQNAHQNNGMFRAYGLAYALLRGGVPVSWVISENKTTTPNDIALATPTVVHNRELGTNITMPENYTGGPFVVAAADHAAAVPIIDAWLAADTVTVVHEVISGSFTANVNKALTSAPSLAVFEDNFEQIAYDNLNTAGILDSAGNQWSATSPGSLSDADIANTAGDNADGKLFVAIGATKFPAFSFLSSEHYAAANPEVVAEVRNWLDLGATPHAFMQCAAISSFENNAAAGTNPGGHFLTTGGFTTPGAAVPNPVENLVTNDPLTQFVGNIDADTGVTQNMTLAAGSTLKAGVRILLQDNNATAGSDMMMIDGNLDGNTAKGRVTYLTGHNYSTATPVSANPLSNGGRLYFNAIFDSPSALAQNQPNVVVTLQGPTATNASTITYTITYTNNGGAPAFGVVITDPVPAGSTFASAQNGGTQAGGIVTWNIGPVAPGGTGTLTYTVNVAADGTLTNQATGTYKSWETPRTVKSNTTSTDRDTVAPDTTIVSGPPDSTSATTANFDFSSDDAAATFECKLDNAADFTACPDPDTLSNLANGSHTLLVRAKDPAGNVDPSPASKTWTVTGGSNSSVDTDGDGIPDDVERRIGTNPNDADSDDDGVPDGMEIDFDKDTDGDGLINALDPDSDNDGLFDGTEMGFDCSARGTDLAKHHCIPDADHGLTKTNPLKRDTDNGGVSDGSEDSNLNGMVDPGETDPTDGHGDDDKTVKDSDGDGLSDDLEKTLGSNPNDADSDDDGVPDGEEVNPNVDSDGDGKTNILDPDSDNDGLFDGTEMGKQCGPGTDLSKNTCIPDADNGATKTSPINPDTDHGGVKDGDEDTNHNGRVDPGERNPNNAADDKPANGGATADGGVNNAVPTLEGGGIDCSTAAPGTGSSSSTTSVLLLLAAAAVVSSRRRNKRI